MKITDVRKFFEDAKKTIDDACVCDHIDILELNTKFGCYQSLCFDEKIFIWYYEEKQELIFTALDANNKFNGLQFYNLSLFTKNGLICKLACDVSLYINHGSL